MKVILAFILSIVLLTGCGSYTEPVEEDDSGALYRIRRLDADGMVWYIYADDPTNWVNRTCITVDLTVAEVTLANEAATEAIVRCE